MTGRPERASSRCISHVLLRSLYLVRSSAGGQRDHPAPQGIAPGLHGALAQVAGADRPTLEPPMEPTTRHVRRFLHGSDAVTALLHEVERREALLARVRALLPESVARHCSQAMLDDGRLALVCDSPAWVDRLRFLAPQLLPALSEPGAAVSACQVHARPAPAIGSRSEPNGVPDRQHNPGTSALRGAAGAGAASAAVQALEQTAATLGDTPLAASLRRLAVTLRHGP